MIKNDEGKVALRYYQTVPKLFHVGTHDYVVQIKYNVAIVFAYPEDVSSFLNIRGGCCGNKKKNLFWEATERDMAVFYTGKY